MSDVFLDHLSYALGQEVHSVEEAAAAGRLLSPAPALKEAGFQRHHVCPAGTTAYDLAKRAVQGLQDRLGDVGAIIYSTCLPVNGSVGDAGTYARTRDVKHLMDFPASHLQADFRLDRAIVIGLNQQACTGLLGAMRLARMLLLTEPEFGRVLCLTADRFPGDALYEQSYNLISDGAAACIVSREPRGYRMLACHGITNGALARATDDEVVGSFFTYTHRVIQETLARAGVTIRDVAWVIPQNTNVKAWQILARLLCIEFERVYFKSMERIAHLVSGDNIINLKSLEDEGRLRPGDRLLLPMAGYGMNWQCVLLERI